MTYNRHYYSNRNMNYPPINSQTKIEEKSSFGWFVLGFFIPIVGFILFFCFKKDFPNRAKRLLKGAITGIITGIAILLINFLILLTFFLIAIILECTFAVLFILFFVVFFSILIPITSM